MKNIVIKILILIIIMLCRGTVTATADDSNEKPRKSWEIDTTQVQNLNFSLHSTVFFQDNEFSTPLMKGYTLPGFKLRPTVDYRPNGRVNVEMGIYMLKFWGTDDYPNLSYTDISEWSGKENVAKGLHLLPFFRVQMATRGGLNFVLGSIYGGSHHQLLEPLYAPELNLTADPEAGAQILYDNKWLYFDTWINWESFIYKNDTHQEAFTFGVSSKLKYTREERKLHLYTPLQILFQHRGGEIDTILTNSVQTLFNGSIGLGAKLNINHRTIKSATLQADALVYNQQVGNLWPFKHGWAYYIHGALDVANVHLKTGYFHSNKFVSLFGYPFFGGISTSHPGRTFDTNSTLFAGIDYSFEFARGYSLGANAMVYRHFPSIGVEDGVATRYGASTSFYGSIYVRLNPSFLLKNFGMK